MNMNPDPANNQKPSLLHRLFPKRDRSNNKPEATAILEAELTKRRGLAYSELRGRLDQEPDTYELTGASGITYQLEFSTLWDDKKDKTILLVGSIDGGDISPSLPLSQSFIKNENDEFVGE